MTVLGCLGSCSCSKARSSNSNGYPTSSRRQLAILASAAFLLFAAGCSSTAKSQFNSLSTVSLSALTPSSMTLAAGAQQQFSISASGVSNTEIVWSLLDSSGHLHFSCSTSNCSDIADTTLGTITAAGLYTAPSASSSLLVYVNAAAVADTSVSRQAAVTVGAQPPPITVTISPTSACVQTGQTADFSAQVSNGSGVTWEVNGSQGGNSTNGTITSSGAYTAPGNPTSVTVTAVSVQDSTKSASATVQVQTSCQNFVTVSASSATVYPGQSVNFTASVSGNPADPAVSWGLNCSNCGQVTYTGQDTMTYIAPSTVSSSFQVTVTATMVSPPGNSGQTTITVVPINPQLSISVSPSGTIYATGDLNPNHTPHSAQLTATLTGVPGGTVYTVTWTQPALGGTTGGFCVTTDQEIGVDNCGDRDGDGSTPDGPGMISSTGTVATYTAPAEVYVGVSGQTTFTNSFILGECQAVLPPGTTIDDANPYVLVTAQTTYNASQVTAQVCIPVQN